MSEIILDNDPTIDMSSMRGIVKRVTYYNDKTTFTVFQLKYSDEDSPTGTSTIACTGLLPDVHKGMLLKLYGAITTNQYGTQYQFKRYEFAEPKFSEEVVSYLSSGLIDEVDTITARKIYDTFGNDTIKILDETPDRLLGIKGIATKKASAIISSWKKHRDSLDVHMLLQRYGLSTETINKIKESASMLGVTVKHLLVNKPYDLVYRYSGISVDTVDMILRDLAPDKFNNYYKNSFERLQCMIYMYIMTHNVETGNVCVPYDSLLQPIANKAGLSVADVDNTIRAEIDCMDHLYWEKEIKSSINYCANGYMYTNLDMHHEFTITSKLLQATYDGYSNDVDQMKNSANEIIDALINHVESDISIEYNDDQKRAIKAVLQNFVSVITGGPGTGKTTIIRGVLSILEGYKDLKVLLLAPTGKAAKRMSEATNHSAQTIHLALVSTNIDEYNCIIVDESSMIDNTLMCMLLSKCSINQRIVFVGDIHQLPSVGPGNVLSNIIDSKLFNVVTLNQIYRQEHGYIIYNAKEINEGRFPSLYNEDSNDFYYIDSINTNYSRMDILDKLLREILPSIANKDGTHDDWYKDLQVISPMKKGESGVANLNSFMQKFFWDINEQHHKTLTKQWHLDDIKSNSRTSKNKFIEENRYPLSIKKGDVVFAVGDRVINNKNNYDKLVFNGETGYIVKIELSEEVLRKVFINKKFRTDRFYDSDYKVYIDFSNGDEDHKPVEFSYEDLDNLSLSYCITIHKSQGSEYKYLIVFLNKEHWIMQQRNLLYTAITRAKSMVILISDVESIGRSISNNQAIQRLTLLKEQLLYYNDHMDQLRKKVRDKKYGRSGSDGLELPFDLRGTISEIKDVVTDSTLDKKDHDDLKQLLRNIMRDKIHVKKKGHDDE